MENRTSKISTIVRQIGFVIISGAFGGIVIFFLLEWLATASFSKSAENLTAKNWRVILSGIIFSLAFYLIAAMPVMLLRKAHLHLSPWIKMFLLILTSAVGGSLAFVAAVSLTSVFLATEFSHEKFFPLILVDSVLAALTTLLLVYLFQLQAKNQQAELREQKLAEAATQARIRVLQAQINPHFLFNTLNTLSALITTDAMLARETVERLAEMFRYTFAASQKKTATVESEVKLVENYLGIEKIRFGVRLDYRIELPENLQNALIPPLILQPFAENAVKHGIAKLLEGGEVFIAVSDLHHKKLKIEIRNDTDVENNLEKQDFFPPEHSLANVKKRLELLYRDNFSLAFEAENKQFRVILELPKEF